MKTAEQQDREIDDLWLLLRLLRGGTSSGSAPITLIGDFVGGEATTSSPSPVDLLILNISPFSAAIGTKLYIAAFHRAGDTSGTVDLFDNTDARSLLAAPISVINNTPSVIYSAALIHPLVAGHSISIRAFSTGDSPQLSVQSAYVF
jgi:hypothetical protein